MTGLKCMPTTQTYALADARTRAHTRAKFYRILVRRDGETKYTTVSVSPRTYGEMLKFASGRVDGVNGVVRGAAARVKATAPGQFSHFVRLKALAMLRGAYRPPEDDAARRLAEANNALWEANG